MEIKDIQGINFDNAINTNITDITGEEIDISKIIVTNPDPNAFHYSACKALMLNDFGAVTGNKSVGIGFTGISM
ncbi:MAG: hypothetical protein F6K65_03350 [Moorea sp. SIO3C2]|nr:hypothetical protein [Moorena sp. SIO3C2]